MQSNQSAGGVEDDGIYSYAATVISAAKVSFAVLYCLFSHTNGWDYLPVWEIHKNNYLPNLLKHQTVVHNSYIIVLAQYAYLVNNVNACHTVIVNIKSSNMK